ncbi:MAG: PolC-type DNA polymerase III [Christensenellales bacterium]|jgi:DNA polymerase-3 subunit alpha (Gram-positive type)
MQDRWKDKLISSGCEADLDGLSLQKVLLDKKRSGVTAMFISDKLPGEYLLESLRKGLHGLFPCESVSVKISCPGFGVDFCRDPQRFAPQLLDMLSARMPAAASHLKSAKWSCRGENLRLTLPSAASVDFLATKRCDQKLSLFIKNLFNISLNVEFIAAKDENRLAEMAQERSETELYLVKSIMEQQPQRKSGPDYSRPLFGRAFKTQPIQMLGLSDMSGRVVIEGEVLSCEKKPINGGNRVLLIFSVTDYSNTIICKLFCEKENERQLDGISKGTWVKVRGDVLYDSYMHDLSITAYDVMPAPMPPQRTDGAPRKRIELHMHTNMSNLDAVASATELIQRAAEWGHKAVAITDHGVVQAFPEAFAAAKKFGIKLIPGVEGYLTDDLSAIAENSGIFGLDGPFVVVDMEMTGTNANTDHAIEIGAVKWQGGKIVDEFSSFIDPLQPLPEKIISLTGITDDMLYGAPSMAQVIAEFAAFAQGCPICAHDVHIDIAFLRKAADEIGLELCETLVDTLALSRALLPDSKSHKLDFLCKQMNVQLKTHHRALPDARATAQLMGLFLNMAKEQGARSLADLNSMFGLKTSAKGRSYHIILLAKNNKGLNNLYKLISTSHLDFFNNRPQMPRSIIERHREGLIIGSACEAGELYTAVLNGRKERDLLKIASFYDFLEIQPNGNNAFLVRDGHVKDEHSLNRINKKILGLGRKLGRPVVATGDVHFLEPRDSLLREILMTGIGFSDADQQPPLYFKTTDEMLEDFDYLGPQDAEYVVIDGPEQVLSMAEEVTLFPVHPEGKPTFQPVIEGAADEIQRMSWENAKAMYGDPLPAVVRERLEKELDAIIGNGFATLYYSAHLLIKKSNEDGYLVGSRGSVGSSFVATMCTITEVNPLPPHFYCEKCRYSDFDIDREKFPCGIDLPDGEICPVCGEELRHTGYDIPFEVFLGFECDKVPDIDLNFSGDYQAKAHAYAEELFGQKNVFRAGTIGSLGDKKAFGYAKNFVAEKERHVTNAEIDRLVKCLSGIKKTTGQHPGGMVIVPNDYEIYDFCPIQNPADKSEKGIRTTHFDFNSLHDLLVKLDILGHDDPTMIRMLHDLTGIDPATLPLNDPETMGIFTSPEPLGLTEEELGVSKGTLGVPEFGTKFVISMLEDTMPTTMEELLRISGLSHGTDVWLGNARDIIRNGIAEFRQCICTRDDIMLFLISRGVPSKSAFNIMEFVRKGRGLTHDMEKDMRDNNVPEWFIDSCKKIKYLFPKAHASAYVIMALRIAWFKVHRPQAYYAAYFTVRADDFDATLMCTDPETILQAIKSIKALGRKATPKDESLMVQLEIAREMLLRGIEFLPMDIYDSDASRFMIVDGKILPPLNALAGVGTAAAQSIVAAREEGPFISVEELQQRSKASKSVIDMLRQQGCLRSLPETSQMRLI